jgi:hypothetical protein
VELFLFSGGFIMARVQGRRSAREQHWRGIFSDWKASGLSISAFCRNRDVAEASFYYWRRELGARGRRVGQDAAAPMSVTEPAFVPVRVVAAEPIEVVVRSGQVLRVGTAFDPAHLRAVVAALEAVPC